MQVRVGSSSKVLWIGGVSLLIGFASCSKRPSTGTNAAGAAGALEGAGAAGQEPGTAGAPPNGAAGQTASPTRVYPKDAAACETFSPAACPEYCSLRGSGPGTCSLRPCEDFTADGCPPSGFCEVVQTCGGGTACVGYALPDCSKPPPESGATVVAADGACCWDWVARCGSETNGECSSAAPQQAATCIPCGNDVCDRAENPCNCPEDCGAPK